MRQNSSWWVSPGPLRDSWEAATSIIARFEIEHLQCLDAEGLPVGQLPAFAEDREALLAMYRAMVLARTFDAKAVSLQRTGRLGTYASALGQEAVSVGTASAMRSEDVFLPSFREHGGQLVRGVTLVELFLFWGGDERGNVFAGPRHDFPVSIPVGSHAPHAVGVALAMKLRREPRAAVAVIGDGATSKGDVYEALNFAGVWRTPVIFVINNNRWAISVPVEKQTASRTLAQKAIAAGIEGLQVDGNDVIAVRAAVERGLERARGGGGAAWIEAVTYRLGDHTTADDASRYRDDALVSPHWHDEPIARLRRHLVHRGMLQKSDEESLLEDCRSAVEAAANEYMATPPQDPLSMFDHLFAVSPADLKRQREAFAATMTVTTSPRSTR